MRRLGGIGMIVVASAALALGCGSTSETTCDECGDGGCGDTDSDGDADAGSDTDPECPDPIAESCPNPVDPVPLLFAASDFGDGTRFVDVAAWSVLAERDAGDARTVSIIACEQWGSEPCTTENAAVASLDVPVDSGLHAVALATSEYGGDPALARYLAVLCDGAGCALYGADLDADPPDTALASVPGGELPPAATVNGLWRDMDGMSVCAYGDGIHCFDGTAWSSPVPASADDPLLNDMATTFGDAPGAIAVGDLGRIAWSGFPHWDGYWGTAYDAWYAVAPYDDGYAIAGAGGRLMLHDGTAWVDACAFADEDIVALLVLTESGLEWTASGSGGVTRSGRVFTADGPVTGMHGACYTDQVVGENPRAVSFRCGIDANVFLADETHVYGTTYCAVD
jgi:hypothetical protein